MATSLENKLKAYMDNLQDAPNCNSEDLYKLADYIELKCLADADGFFSAADFVDIVRPNAEDLGQGDFEEMESEKKRRTSKSEKNDRWEMQASEIFNILLLRTKVFVDYYPFSITENHSGINVKGDLTLNNKKYIFLLLSANLQFTRDFKKELTGSFEYMSREVLTQLLPEKALVKLFGSSNSEQPEEWVITESKFWDKLKILENLIKGNIRIGEDEINKYNKGDGGLDLVAIVPLGDEQSHFPIIFGQCACSADDWTKKQHDIKAEKWRQKMHLTTIPLYFMFIPQNYRQLDGNWFRGSEIIETVLMDRQRILSNFNSDEKFVKYSSFDILERIINTKEGAF